MTTDNKEVLDEMFRNKSKKQQSKKSTGPKDEIICIVDRSGSMASIQKDAEGGLNSFILEQKKLENGANITIIEFDSVVDTVYDQIDINESIEYNLRPRGSTALLDAIGLVVSDELKYKTEGKTIVVVVTDGGENSSQEWTQTAIFDLINERKEQGWEFVFLAANQDAIKSGTSYGFDANSTISFAPTKIGARRVYDATTNYVSSLRSGPKLDALASKTAYVEAHKDVLSETGEVTVEDNNEKTS